jgi:hypothetical protein
LHRIKKSLTFAVPNGNGGNKKTKQRKADLSLKGEEGNKKRGVERPQKKIKKTSCRIRKRFSPLQSQNKRENQQNGARPEAKKLNQCHHPNRCNPDRRKIEIL